MLLVPRPLVDSIDPHKKRLVLLHELLHLRRGDHLVRWFALAVLAIHWWNPVAWWAVRRMQDAQEECCDAAVLALHPQHSQTYGEALLAVSEFISGGRLPAAAVSIGVERPSHLKRRMTMILSDRRWAKLSKLQLAAILFSGAVAIAITWKAATAQVAAPAETKPSATQPPKQTEHGQTPHEQAGHDQPAATIPPRPTAKVVTPVSKPAAADVATVANRLSNQKRNRRS